MGSLFAFFKPFFVSIYSFAGAVSFCRHAALKTPEIPRKHLGCRKWGCNKWGLKGRLAALPGNRPKSAKIALFLPRAPGKSRKRREKGLFPQISSDLLKPPSLKPPFAALQKKARHLCELFSEVRANFCLLPCDTSQEPNGNCSEKPCSDKLFLRGGGIFQKKKNLMSAIHGQTIKDPPLDVQEINGVQEIPSQERSWHRICLFYSVLVP